jgi:hypothetical protein
VSIGPTDKSFEKHCFAYCGDDVCDCGRKEENDMFIKPAIPGVEYEWKGISECLEAGLDVAKMLSEEGWEFVGGALRRPKR